MRFLDANIILRYLTKDDPTKAASCFDLLQKVETGKEQVTTSEVILHEVLYVLTSRRQYNLSHDEAAARLRPILTLRGLRLPDRRLYLRALDLFGAYPFLDFADAVSIAHMEGQGLTEIWSYDTDFDRVPGVSRVEP